MSIVTVGTNPITWDAIQSALNNLALNNKNFSTSFNQTSAVQWLWANTTLATSNSPTNSPVLALASTIFNGSVSVQDKWTIQNIPDPTINNGTTALKFLHTGTAGLPMVSIGDVNSLSPLASTFFSDGSPNLFGPFETTMASLQVFGHSQAPDTQALFVVNDYVPINDFAVGASIWSFITNNTGSDTTDAVQALQAQAIHQGSNSVQSIEALSLATESDGTFTTPVPQMICLEILGNLSPVGGPLATKTYGILLYDQNQGGVSGQTNYGIYFKPQTTTGGTTSWCIFEQDATCNNQLGPTTFLGAVTFNGSGSGSAAISVAAAAGTPNPLVLPTTTGAAGAVLTTNGLNPQQLSWTAPSALTVVWNNLQNASGALTLANAGNATTFNQTSAVNWTWANTTAATSGTSQSSPIWNLNGTYWTGAASAVDSWQFQNIVANGTNGAVRLSITHSGSAGAAQIGTVSGLIGSPAYSFNADLSSGMWLNGAGDVNISSAGAIAARFNNSLGGIVCGPSQGIIFYSGSRTASLYGDGSTHTVFVGTGGISGAGILQAGAVVITDTAANTDLTIKNTTAATSGTSQSSPLITLNGTYWTGAASATDSWTLQNVIANGTNGASTLIALHSGSTGTASFSIGTPGSNTTAYSFKLCGTTLDSTMTQSAGAFSHIVGSSASWSLSGSSQSFAFYGAGTSSNPNGILIIPQLGIFNIRSSVSLSSTWPDAASCGNTDAGILRINAQSQQSAFVQNNSGNIACASISINPIALAPSSLISGGLITLATGGSAGSTTWGYKFVGVDVNGFPCGISPEVTIATGNANLSAGNFITITGPAEQSNWHYPGIVRYDVYRTTVGTSPTSTGRVGFILKPQPGQVAQTLRDNGIIGDGTVPPSSVNFSGTIVTVNSITAGSYNVQANPSTLTQTQSDNLTRANENPLSNGGNWSAATGAGDAGQLSSNTATPIALNTNSVPIWTANPAAYFGNNQYSAVTVSAATLNTYIAGAVVRGLTSGNAGLTCYRFYVNGPLGSTARVVIDRIVNGTQAYISAFMTYTVNVGDILKLSIFGNMLTGYVNGTPVIQVTDTAISTGYPGMMLFAPTGGATSGAAISAWTGGTVAAATNYTVSNGGIVTTYAGAATASQGIPSIIAAPDFTAQSAQITTTNLVASLPRSGRYRVSWSAAITTADGVSSTLGGTNGFQVTYTSPTDSVSKTTVPGNSTTSTANTTGTATSGHLTVFAKTATALSFTYGYTSNTPGSMVYELHITVEAL